MQLSPNSVTFEEHGASDPPNADNLVKEATMYQHLDDTELLADIAATTERRDRFDRRARAGRYDSQDAAVSARIESQRLTALHIERQARGIDIDTAA